MIFSGKISVKSILENTRRQVEKVYIEDGKYSKDFNYIQYLCHKRSLPIVFLNKEELQHLAQHPLAGGVCLEASNRHSDFLTDQAYSSLLVEGVEDPYSLGDILRSAMCFGIDQVILPQRDYTNMEVTLMRSSAGAWDRLPMIFTDQMDQDLVALKKAGVLIVGALRSDQSKDLGQAYIDGPCCLCIGGTKRGLSSRVTQHIDVALEISYPSSKMALSGPASSSIFFYKMNQWRTRQCK